jgi:hypothetical protein
MSADAEGEVDPYSRLFSAVGNPAIVSKTSGFVFCKETQLIVEEPSKKRNPRSYGLASSRNGLMGWPLSRIS